MSVKVSSIKSTSKKTVGVWLSPDTDSDVHVYVQKGIVVIGENKSYKDKIEFSDLALIFEGNEIRFQYVDKEGKPATVSVSPETAREAVLTLLNSVKEKVLGVV